MLNFLQRLIPEPLRSSRKWQLIWLLAMVAVLTFIAAQMFILSMKCLSGEPVTTIRMSESNRLPNISILMRHRIVSDHLQSKDFSTNVTWKGIRYGKNVTEELDANFLSTMYLNTFVKNPAYCRVPKYVFYSAKYLYPDELYWIDRYPEVLKEHGGVLNFFKRLLPPLGYFVDTAKFEMNQRADVVTEGYDNPDYACVSLCNFHHARFKMYIYPNIAVSSQVNELGVAYILNTSVMPMDRNTDIFVRLMNINKYRAGKFYLSAGSASKMLDFLGLGLDLSYDYTLAMTSTNAKNAIAILN